MKQFKILKKLRKANCKTNANTMNAGGIIISLKLTSKAFQNKSVLIYKMDYETTKRMKSSEEVNTIAWKVSIFGVFLVRHNSPFSVRMRENTDQKKTEIFHVVCSFVIWLKLQVSLFAWNRCSLKLSAHQRDYFRRSEMTSNLKAMRFLYGKYPLKQ